MGHSRQEMTDPPRVRCDSLKRHWSASTVKFGARSGISFCKATREFVEKELSALTKTRVSHKTFWDEAQTCASYYRQKKLSKFVAEC